ncbi:MAG: ATP-dependent RecD-like DNA helicase [Chlorobiaceae bacterium]|nr:ATP-dependent RecD-like DNA helicase [Chlorobiaceae bacterium]
MSNDSSESPIERLSGSVERVTYHSAQTGFSVLRLKVRGKRELVTVVGTAASPVPGEFMECLGAWKNDRTHGMQFKASSITPVAPTTLDGIERYLGSGLVKGLGPYFAKKLVKAFGDSVFDVIELQPERLLEVAGIGEKRVAMITASWAEQKAVRDIMVFLQSHGVGTARAWRIYRLYGDAAIAMVTENPYRLSLDIESIGFQTADTIAESLGIEKNSLIRAEAGIRHVLRNLSLEGHCAVPEEALAAEASSLLGIDRPIVAEALDAEKKRGNVVGEDLDGQSCVFLIQLHQAEKNLALGLMRLRQGTLPWKPMDPHDFLPWIEQETGLELSPSQRSAVTLVLSSKVSIITGGPGVGKTTLLRAILSVLRRENVPVALCAPTGRAAKRLTESTGIEAKTIHRLLEFDPKAFDFRRGRGNPLDAAFVVVDETSMVDVVLMQKLIAAVPDKAAIVFVGDVDQLPSVGPGAVLADMISSEALPTVRLTEIFRQAAESMIIVNAHRINQGQMPLVADGEALSDFYLVPASSPDDLHAKLMQLVTQRIPKRFGLDPVRDIQVLTPMNRGGIGARALNADLQAALNGSAEPKVERFGSAFAPGDKVIQMVNNYDKEVFNGDIGLVESVNADEGLMTVLYDRHRVEYAFGELDEVALAYATSIHKSQGSEYPAVVVPLAMQHFTLLERNLVYTAVTRGKKLVVVVAEPKALAMAVQNCRSKRRLTSLASRLSSPGMQSWQNS